MEDNTWILVIGFVAAFFTTISQFPQVVKVIRSKNTSGLSLTTYITLCIGVIIWAIYGFFIDDLPLIISNFLILLMAGTILYHKLKNKYFYKNTKNHFKGSVKKLPINRRS